MRRLLFLIAAVAIFPFACTTTTTSTPASSAGAMTAPPPAPEPPPPPPPPPAPKPMIGDHGFDVTGVDRSANACDDFYRFAVGNWRQAHPLPAQFSRFGRFEEVAEHNRETLRQILEADSANTTAPAGSDERKIGDFYTACMNEEAIEMQGLNPIKPELDRIDAIKTRKDLRSEIYALEQAGYNPLFDIDGEQDFKNSKMNIAVLGQGGLSLPDRDYYLRDDARFSTIRNQYVDHVTKMLTLAGRDAKKAASDAQRILAFEKRLAEGSMSRVDQRLPEKTYNITPVTQLASTTPNFDWPGFLRTLHVNEKSVNVEEPTFFQTVNKMLADVPVADWKAYLRWRVLRASAASLATAIAEENFNFTGRILSGQKEQLPRWKRCIRQTDASIGDLLGQEYIRRNFTPEAKDKLNGLIDNLVEALRAAIPTLD
ncbi:MAG TPA: M13 family metallopeptidase N-terminal domain-containing protein, partial [Thermoanaerobaculia bacterium]|nr:M13 family metallopeptidase N-terminal domain-containing protein [Thermoanaerobaculia bacterium]